MTTPTPEQWMARALTLARRGRYTTHPNPRVGCVLVKDGRCVGEGFHRRAGEPHAEILALRAAGDTARGATAYVTLEPCAHQGRTGPCARALVKAGVARVVAAMQDPNPRVAGQGFAILREAGVEVASGLLETEARRLNPGFIRRMSEGRPFVRLKMAMSLDGRTAMSSGESQWITGPQARAAVQRLRARSSAVMTGVESIIFDNSRLTVRADQLGLEDAEAIAERQPLRVVVDSRLRLPEAAACLREPGRTLVATCSEDVERRERLEAAGAEVLVLPVGEGGRVDLDALLHHLASVEESNEVLLETGATLAGAMFDAGLVDELQLFMAPTLLGGEARPLFQLPGLERMAQQRPLEILDIRAIGQDWRITARPKAAIKPSTQESP
ncbi:bifunctional diaminohydroxyphosphoribosylaminopyrimidine deaminase/5-amino-6-(5-phosphoribosylamino)uracil reductase RibD [Halomonas sp. 328]|uniref:bifunctional diaminohydroxyphosphoribosylaminopyrimidine deaminase/5-amino-6-(5-phosphoribosylamino)uracil reductase RibD n=1 Tax=Halomonas sp. 328 TaxID=2776704 RepID=UPI0018A7D360|nr:bifunctional diaminohydroxyphosphoribosylaminopyrimidine deaminase/5-amino-6-(5-phosphoribosylamino)uracil reductase RibD [Halomonas sp. 328]MBF8221394.1 bifunctional diaminohydroxyphosphoribosylaminopyrimidine deaminase/5-amino-6-(5-phosphoribosylamino)uracil reductase RibD [Halomonas sp. 328]